MTLIDRTTGALQPGWVYRCFDADNRLLYIGSTTRTVERRTKELRRGEPWGSQIAWVTSERYDRWTDARRAESMAILAENPLHNKRRSAPPSRFSNGWLLMSVGADGAEFVFLGDDVGWVDRRTVSDEELLRYVEGEEAWHEQMLAEEAVLAVEERQAS